VEVQDMHVNSRQIVLYTTYRRFGLIDEIETKDCLLCRLDAVKRGAAMMSIQGFKWCHLEALSIAIVLWELSPWQILIPIALMFHHTCSEHILHNLIFSFYLAICLPVTSWGVDQVSSDGSMQLLPEMKNKLWPSIGNDHLLNSM
jgi:hypothetical protein